MSASGSKPSANRKSIRFFPHNLTKPAKKGVAPMKVDQEANRKQLQQAIQETVEMFKNDKRASSSVEPPATKARRSKKRPTDIFDFLDAVEDVIKSAPPEKRAALAQTINAYAKDFPEEFFWATGPQAPNMLHMLMVTVDISA
jgi:hypothetical protein